MTDFNEQLGQRSPPITGIKFDKDNLIVLL